MGPFSHLFHSPADLVTSSRFALIAALLLLGCDSPAPAKTSPQRAATAPPVEQLEESAPHLAPQVTLSATPDANWKVGDTVAVCWQAPGHTDCTLSILHASGEGDFGEVAARGCREVIVERTTLIELFCQGDTHALLQLDAAE